MARELILIPKMKYEQLMNDSKKNRNGDNTQEERKNVMEDPSKLKNQTVTKSQNDVKEKSTNKVDKKSYIEMKPKDFFYRNEKSQNESQ